jgi:hypothetical protein
MKGYIQGNTIILLDKLPENISDGDKVEIELIAKPQDNYPFPTFNLSIKEEYLNREKIYETEQNLF